MFLDNMYQKNRPLVELGVSLLKSGVILPDSYVLDVDTFLSNAKHMLEEANHHKIDLYFMLKQVGRNPYLASKLVEMGYMGAVVVDYKEALVMMAHNIPIANIGHLVQTPDAMLHQVILYRPLYMTIFSMEKLKAVNAICEAEGMVQAIILRVYDENDTLYSGQDAGISLSALATFLSEAKTLKGIKIAGMTSFPCFLFNEERKDIEATENVTTVLKAVKIARTVGIEIKNINLPSATCCHTIPLIKKYGGTSGEPGHGLSGSTPAHLVMDLVEQPCVIYVSEISHHFNGHSYCYGGGHYRRSKLRNGLVGEAFDALVKTQVIPPSDDSIDYYFKVVGHHKVGAAVIMAFRFQLFVTRSALVLVEGLSKGHAQIIGIYDGSGGKYE